MTPTARLSARHDRRDRMRPFDIFASSLHNLLRKHRTCRPRWHDAVHAPPPAPDYQAFRATETKYHGDMISSQLRLHNAPLVHATTIDTVTATASRTDTDSLTLLARSPCLNPRMPGTKNKITASLGRSPGWNAGQRKRIGTAHNTPLAQTVWREIDPTTKPADHDQANIKKT